MRNIIKWLCRIVFFSSCHCRFFKEYDFEDNNTLPIQLIDSNRYTAPCVGGETITLGVLESKQEYKITEDSTGYGYVAMIYYTDREEYTTIIVGTGSEFEVGKCRFKVLKVYEEYYEKFMYNGRYLSDKIALQTLSIPKSCSCKNKKLQQYAQENIDSTWEEKFFRD